MATDVLLRKQTYPCKIASQEKLDDMLRESRNPINSLNEFIYAIEPANIRWEEIHHLRMIVNDDGEYFERFRAAGIQRGCYCSADGTWMLVILLKNADVVDPTQYLTQCSSELKTLEIRNTSVAMGILDISRLSGLTELTIRDCTNLTVLSGLEHLLHLTKLCLSGCGSLTALQGVKNLPQLTELNLAGCHSLTQLSPLDGLDQLSVLNLSNCKSLPELPGLINLPRLFKLDLSCCHSLTKLPELRYLPELEIIDLSDTAITSLPKSICKLDSLRYLNLSDLRMTEFPHFLIDIASKFLSGTGSITDRLVYKIDVKIAELEYDEKRNSKQQRERNSIEDSDKKVAVALFDTSIQGVDMSIFDQPYEVLAKWFEEQKRGRTQPLNEIKVVFLGDGEAGKSHTIARLMNDGGEPDHAIFDGQSTPGIVIRNKEYDLGDRTIQVHYWDFGGQEIMHSMHRIFLTGRTMYVILLNARDDTQSDRAKYWLHNVKSFAPNAPVLLVLNKIDQNESASVDERDLWGRYEKLTQVVKLSALKYSQEEFNNCFTNVLLEEIQKTGFLDAQWPIAWTKVKDKLENMETHYIMGSDYQALCQECKVDDNQKNLLHWFNDLGISFCCDGEDDYTLEDYVILRPDWITNALYIILFNTMEGVRNGLIPHRSIYNLLKNAHTNHEIRCTLPQARYTSSDIDYVLRIMRKFNLSFTDGQDNEFIPMLCQQNSLVDVQYYQRDSEILEFNMEFDYLPNNLLHRLMVERYSELDMETVWRTGARFQLPELGLSAVLVIDGNTLRFFIRHTDSMHHPNTYLTMHHPNTYLTMLKAHVDRIVAKMGLKAPSCKLVYKLDGQRDEFDFENLKLWQKLGMPGVPSPSHGIVIPFQDILNQSAPDNLDDEKKLLEKIIQACGNIQDEPIYRLVPKSNGQGYVNGKGMEDLRNRRVRDNLINIGYRMSDQSQRGSSGTGKSIGELDMLVYNDSNEPWTIIEALRVSDKDKTEWNKHLKKLSDNYNTRGFPALYLLTYVDADNTTFAQIWESYQEHIKTYAPGQLKYADESFVELNASQNQYIKVAKCRYSGGVDPITVYHIFARIHIQNG